MKPSTQNYTKSFKIFQDAAQKMLDAGVHPADLCGALLGVATATAVDSFGDEMTRDWLNRVSENLTQDRPPVTIN